MWPRARNTEKFQLKYVLERTPHCAQISLSLSERSQPLRPDQEEGSAQISTTALQPDRQQLSENRSQPLRLDQEESRAHSTELSATAVFSQAEQFSESRSQPPRHRSQPLLFSQTESSPQKDLNHYVLTRKRAVHRSQP